MRYLVRTPGRLIVLLLLAVSNILLCSSKTTHPTNESDASLWGTEDCDTVACRFKAPHPRTPPGLVQQWKQEDAEMWEFVERAVPDVLEHTGTAAFDEHLKGVQAVLRYWQAPLHVTKAGLFHSIYGTEGFQGFALPISMRSEIQSLIGKHAEKLVFVFCMVDRYTFDETLFHYHANGSATTKHDSNQTFQVRARPELGRFVMDLTKEEWLDFMELTLADWMEQVEGAAAKSSNLFLWKEGEAYAYRRLAFQKMSQLLAVERAPRLSQVAPQMVHDVMATEDSSTRHLVQPRTPPMSQSAANALAALRAAREDERIPDDLSPQPFLFEDYEQQDECPDINEAL